MDSMTMYSVAGLALLSGGATFIGVIFGRRFNRPSRVAFSVSFAAGIMILIALLELMPAAFESGSVAISLVGLCIGMAALWLANTILPHLHTVREYEQRVQTGSVTMAYLIAIGLVLHDFPEGFAIPSSFGHARTLGWLVVLATFIHNIPEGFILTVASSPTRRAGVFSYKAAMYSTISTVIGALFGFILVGFFEFLNPLFLSLAAGAMLFITGHELIPYARHAGRGSAAGYASAVMVYFALQVIF